MKNLLAYLSFISSAFFIPLFVSDTTYADAIANRIQAVFGETKIQLIDYDDRLKEVVVGPKSYFATHDGRYVFSGRVIDTQSRQDIVELRAKQRRKTWIETAPKSVFLSYRAEPKEKHRLTVFTDVDCPYCRKMHAYMDDFNRSGITVNYVMLPRAGLGSASSVKIVSALCSADPHSSMTRVMNGEVLPKKTCDNTLAEQYALAMQLGISSTPVTVMPDGSLKLGLTSPDAFLSLLDRG